MTSVTSDTAHSMYLLGSWKGHEGWVTSIKAHKKDEEETIISGGRDKKLILWKISRTKRDKIDETTMNGEIKKTFEGHKHFISDIDISNDKEYAISSSWDGTLILWNLLKGSLVKIFRGHKKDVLSVQFSPDNRYIISGSMDRSIKIWNTLSNYVTIFTSQLQPFGSHLTSKQVRRLP